MNKTAKEARKTNARTRAEKEKPFKDMDILDHLEKIHEITASTGLENYNPKGKRHLDYLTKKLGVSPLQAVLFSHFLAQGDDNNIHIKQIADSGHCNPIRMVKYMTECEELEKKKLIRCSRGNGSVSYRIPFEVKDSLRKNNEYTPMNKDKLDINKFFVILEELFEEKSNGELTSEALTGELLNLIKENMQLEFCKKIMSYNFHEDDLVLLACFCHLFGNNNDDHIGNHDFGSIYDNKFLLKEITSDLSAGTHNLIENKFIEFNNDDGFVNNESWKLTDIAKKELLSEINVKKSKNYKKNLVLFDTIKAKKMFYNSRETKEIETLSSLLMQENYSKIQERLDGKGMRKGFACLFSGAPGTGKTETAYQIARETKRNIMMVDISRIKSKWVGESEKRIKEIFDTYRNAVENSEITPILLFNEADAIIGKRKEFSAASRAVDQMENTVQNIILSEMETLCGIMIATTNLTQNMDNAFERRFLYKIAFDRPGIEIRKGIWNSLLPDLSEEQLIELSSKFDLSGGQIENITRKIEVDAILTGKDLILENLTQYCKDEVENSFNSIQKSIGFMP